MDPVLPVLMVVTLVALVLLLKWLSGPHTVVRIAGGQASVDRGRPPVRLVHDLDDVARAAPAAEGRVELRGRGSSLTLRTPGLEEPLRQRVRNVVLLYRDRL